MCQLGKFFFVKCWNISGLTIQSCAFVTCIKIYCQDTADGTLPESVTFVSHFAHMQKEPIKKHLEIGGKKEKEHLIRRTFIAFKAEKNQQESTARGSLLVQGATLEAHHCPVASRDVLQCFNSTLAKVSWEQSLSF